eukprot:TRINITY_DN26050_c0_g1_i1.p1 TRINITY_DN26050_c0_g1~~TRINITY_DN26050_c0_g1_i1.p1  ORF type:complete len:475 (+),score=104.95 TRINITY_DN26050_c0_g1_i1:68-1426(+)
MAPASLTQDERRRLVRSAEKAGLVCALAAGRHKASEMRVWRDRWRLFLEELRKRVATCEGKSFVWPNTGHLPSAWFRVCDATESVERLICGPAPERALRCKDELLLAVTGSREASGHLGERVVRRKYRDWIDGGAYGGCTKPWHTEKRAGSDLDEAPAAKRARVVFEPSDVLEERFPAMYAAACAAQHACLESREGRKRCSFPRSCLITRKRGCRVCAVRSKVEVPPACPPAAETSETPPALPLWAEEHFGGVARAWVFLQQFACAVQVTRFPLSRMLLEVERPGDALAAVVDRLAKFGKRRAVDLSPLPIPERVSALLDLVQQAACSDLLKRHITRRNAVRPLCRDSAKCATYWAFAGAPGVYIEADGGTAPARWRAAAREDAAAALESAGQRKLARAVRAARLQEPPDPFVAAGRAESPYVNKFTTEPWKYLGDAACAEAWAEVDPERQV